MYVGPVSDLVPKLYQPDSSHHIADEPPTEAQLEWGYRVGRLVRHFDDNGLLREDPTAFIRIGKNGYDCARVVRPGRAQAHA